MEYIKFKDVMSKVLKHDVLKPSKDDHANYKNFVDDANAEWLAINSWLNFANDLGAPVGLCLNVAQLIENVGLIDTFSACDAVSKRLLTKLEEEASLPDPNLIISGFVGYELFIARIAAGIMSDSRVDDANQRLHNTLCFLFYLKRFTFNTVDKSKFASSLQKFKDANKVCKHYNYDWSVWPGQTVIRMVRAELNEMLKIRHFKFHMTDCNFSNGATTDCIRVSGVPQCKVLKYHTLAEHTMWHKGDFNHPYPLHLSRNERLKAGSVPVVIGVPKDFGSFRIIAPESVVTNYIGGGVLEALRLCLIKSGTMRYINERDQDVNRELARIGSVTRGYATIDMSSASDSISKYLFHAVAPAWYSDVIQNLESYEIKLGYKKSDPRLGLHILLTSGNRVTWLNEALYFLALARVGCQLAGCDWKECYAFGDDLIVPGDAFETVAEVLKLFGHTVNLKKSYNTGNFRESCGAWWFEGMDMTPIYWPRAFVKRNNIALTAADLQHKFISAGAEKAAEFVRDAALHYHPTMTYSSVGSEFDDLWDEELDPWYDDTMDHTHKVFDKTKWHGRDSLIEHVAYYEFLQYGPLYVSDEDRELGISSSRYDVLMSVSIPDSERLVP